MKTLKEVSSLVGMSRRVIQEYEKAGLACTPTTKNKYGYLLYDQSHIDRLMQIRFYRELGYEKRQIQKILDDPDYDHQGAMQDRILRFKQKKMELENLITMAETAEATGLSPKDICTGIPGFRNASYNMLIPTMCRTFRLFKEHGEEFTEEGELTPMQQEACLDAVGSLLDLMDEEIAPDSPEAQAQCEILYQQLSPLFSPSILLFSGRILPYAPGTVAARELDEALWPGCAEYLYGVFHFYCLQHVKNPADDLLKSAISGILSCFRRGLSPDSDEVRQQVKKVHRFYDMIHIYTPEARLKLLRNFGRVFDLDTVQMFALENIPAELLPFLSRAIELYCEEEEKEKIT